MFLERRDTTDLFAAAKAAALEQRALEMEKRNADLLAQIETLKGGAGHDDLNRVAAHKAWQEHVATLENKMRMKDTEIANLRLAKAQPAPSHASAPAPAPAPAHASAPAHAAPSGGAVDWHRVVPG